MSSYHGVELSVDELSSRFNHTFNTYWVRSVPFIDVARHAIFGRPLAEACTQDEDSTCTNWLVWNPSAWTSAQSRVESSSSHPLNRSLRSLVLQSTVNICRLGKYYPSWLSGSKRAEVRLQSSELSAASFGTVCYRNSSTYGFDDTASRERFTRNESRCQVRVLNSDCVDAAFSMFDVVAQRSPSSKPKVAVLNMANHIAPSIEWPMSFATQEENLHRRSNLYMCLDDLDGIDSDRNWSYPLDEFGSVFSPGVTFFRSSEKSGYGLLERPRKLGVLTSAALASPMTRRVGGERWLTDAAAMKTKRKIECLFKVCLENGYRSVVLSAYGCGAFRNPPGHIAEIFAEVIKDSGFDFYFDDIWFAILEDNFSFHRWNVHGNLMPFAKAFQVARDQIEVLDYFRREDGDHIDAAMDVDEG